MMSQKRLIAGPIEDPGGSRDMPLGETALETARIAFHKITEAQRRISLGGVTHQVIFKEVEERLAVHGREKEKGAPIRPGGTAH